MKKKSLRKFTESEKKVRDLFSLEKVPKESFDVLTKEEQALFYDLCTDKINELKSDERDRFINQVEEVMPQGVKNQLWENNHYVIISAISEMMEEYGRMPTKNLIAEKTGLSRVTVYKHLKEFEDHPRHKEEMRKFKLMTDRVLSKVFKYAMNGEVKAARLYFEVLGYLGGKSQSGETPGPTQNNYIQINHTILDQKAIACLSQEQLNSIEATIKTMLPQQKIAIQENIGTITLPE